MTQCECGCENNGNCTNAKYYEQEHNGYYLLKESRLYYANEQKQSASRKCVLHAELDPMLNKCKD